MTEHDRGAYTPTPDAPLQFDARGAYQRKPMPMTLIGSAAVLAVLVGALALHYRHDTRTGPEPRPVGAPIAEVKSTLAPPAAAAQSQPPPQPQAKTSGAAANGAVDVFGGSALVAQNTVQATAQPAAAGKAPTFAPPPEAPDPRLRLKVQTVDGTPSRGAPNDAAAPIQTGRFASAPSARPAPSAPAKAAPALASSYHAPGAAAAPAPPAAVKPSASSVIARIADSASPKPVVAAASPPPARSAAAVFGGSVVQIGAFSSMSLSDKGWRDVAKLMGEQMSGKLKRVEAIEKDGKTYYRTSVTGFPSRNAATAFCRALSAKGFDCFAKG